MLNLNMPELTLILVIALVVFGPQKLPEVGKSLGRGLREFRRATNSEVVNEKANTVEAMIVEAKNPAEKQLSEDK